MSVLVIVGIVAVLAFLWYRLIQHLDHVHTELIAASQPRDEHETTEAYKQREYAWQGLIESVVTTAALTAISLAGIAAWTYFFWWGPGQESYSQDARRADYHLGFTASIESQCTTLFGYLTDGGVLYNDDRPYSLAWCAGLAPKPSYSGRSFGPDAFAAGGADAPDMLDLVFQAVEPLCYGDRCLTREDFNSEPVETYEGLDP